MSADEWRDCPCCEKVDSVRIDGLYDYHLNKDGTIENSMKGFCVECKQEFKIKGN